jgi:hypothetical protein
LRRYHYEIRVESHLDGDWAGWFEGLTIHQDTDGRTILRGLLDQAALHGVFIKIRDLGLPLISVNRIEGGYHEIDGQSL